MSDTTARVRRKINRCVKGVGCQGNDNNNNKCTLETQGA